jgi:L-cysteine S-thiosulfotransferase
MSVGASTDVSASASALTNATGATSNDASTAFAKPYSLSELRSGATYMSAPLRAQQKDDDQNPAMLWVDQGREMFARDCAVCHTNARVLATKLPRVTEDGSVATLEAQINRCQTSHMKKPALTMESETLLALASYVAFSSRGLPQAVAANVTGTAAWFRAREMFTRVQGRLDFSCATCHDKLAGKRVRTQTISQGHGVGFPAYRVEWQTMGSLNRRIRACFYGMESNVPTADDPILADLELYLAWRSAGLTIEAPAVRR